MINKNVKDYYIDIHTYQVTFKINKNINFSVLMTWKNKCNNDHLIQIL